MIFFHIMINIWNKLIHTEIGQSSSEKYLIIASDTIQISNTKKTTTQTNIANGGTNSKNLYRLTLVPNSDLNRIAKIEFKINK